MLSDVAPFLKRLSYGQSLSVEETRLALNTIGDEDRITDPETSDGLYFLALTMGLMAKGPSVDELYGLVLSLRDKSANFSIDLDPRLVTDVSGTGGDRVKTLNVGTTASFVIAASGAFVAKQTTRAYTGKSGSADIFTRLGFDVMSCADREKIEDCLVTVGLTAFHPPALSADLRYRAEFLKKLKNVGLLYLTPWHLVAWVHAPLEMGSRVYGVFDGSYLHPLAKIFQRLGYERALVVNGLDGLDELSNLGPTRVCELRDGEIVERTVTPEELGVTRSEVDAVRVSGRQESFQDFLAILYGRCAGAKRDLVAINAGAALYAMGRAETLREGTELALALIEDGAGARKLEAFARYHGCIDKLDGWREAYDLS